MSGDLLATLLAFLQVFRPALTEPGYRNMLVVFAGWVRTSGLHAMTEALVVTGVSGRRHHEAFHRFFSRGTWSPDELARLLFVCVLRLLPDGSPILAAVDDTLAPKSGPHVFGIGNHLDPVRSTQRVRIFCFGHCWVVLAIIVPLPFSQRTWALPLLFRLHRSKKECAAHDAIYRKKTELVRGMLDVLGGWVGDRQVRLTADSAYCNATVTRGLADNFRLYGAMRPDAVLSAPPPERTRTSGRPRIRGERLPTPEALAKDPRIPWIGYHVMLRGRFQVVRSKTLCAQWYRACGVRLLRIVVVRIDEGAIGLRVFFSMNPDAAVEEVLEGYAERWGIETCSRNLKQLLGFADSCARKAQAVARIAPFVGLI